MLEQLETQQEAFENDVEAARKAYEDEVSALEKAFDKATMEEKKAFADGLQKARELSGCSKPGPKASQ